MSFFLIIISIITASILLIYLWWRNFTNYLAEGLKSLDGPYSYPIIGAILEGLPPKLALWKAIALFDIYGKTYKLILPYTVLIATKDPDFTEHIMTSTKCINKGYLYKFLRNWLRDGLLLSGSSKWRQRRKMITPTFHFKILEEFIEVFNRNSDILVNQLEKACKGDSVNIFDYITLCALDNINDTAMGTRVNAQLNANSDFVKATKYMTNAFYNRAVSVHKFVDSLYFLTADYRKEKKVLEILHGYTLSVINSRRQELLKKEKPEEDIKEDENFGIKKRTAFLDLLLQATINGKPLSDEDIMEEVDTFMFEGHDTISAGISFCLFLIAGHPEVQSKLIEEQRIVFGDNQRGNSTAENLKEMTYLEMTVKEALRLYPSVPGITRIAMEDFQYKDLLIRKGTELAVAIIAIHKDKDLYENPEAFIPERFASDKQQKHPFAYLPFSAGHRNCVGQKFAILEMKSTISRILREFELGNSTPEHKLSLPSAIVLHSENGVKINLKKRVW